MSPFGANASAIGLLRPPASLVWVNPAARAPLTVPVEEALTLNEAVSVPVRVAAAETEPPAGAVTCPVNDTVHV